MVEQRFVNLAWQLAIDDFCGFVEDVAEDAVVEFLLVVGNVGLLDIGHVAIIELQGTAHVFGDGRRREHRVLRGELRLDDLHDVWRLLDGCRLPLRRQLSGEQRVECNSVWTLDHQLENEAAHLAALTVLGGIVVEDGDVTGTLQ